MPTEVSKIWANSTRASTKTFLMLSSVRSSGGGNEPERDDAETRNLIRLADDDVRGGTDTISIFLLLSRGLCSTIGDRTFEMGKALQVGMDNIVVWLWWRTTASSDIPFLFSSIFY